MVRASSDDAVAAVKGADPRSGLAESSVVGRNREIAHQVQDVAAAYGVAGDLGDHRLGQSANLDLQVEHVESTYAGWAHLVVAEVAVVAADALVAARAEGVGAGAREDDDADAEVVAGAVRRRRDSSNSVWGRKAFRTSGRLMVMRAMPSATS